MEIAGHQKVSRTLRNEIGHFGEWIDVPKWWRRQDTKECRGRCEMKLAIFPSDIIMRATAAECCASFLAYLGR
jgi:hypothetical protein